MYVPRAGDVCIIKEYPNDLHVIIEREYLDMNTGIYEIDFADNQYRFIKRKRFFSAKDISDGKLIFLSRKHAVEDIEITELPDENPGIVNPIWYDDYPTTKEEIERAFDILKNMCRGK